MTEQEEVIMRLVLLMGLAPLFAISLGCSSSICDRLASAERAVLAARAEGVPRFLADEFAALEASLAEMRQESDREGKKLILFRNFTDATERGRQIEAEALRLVAAANEKKQRARALALEALERARQSVQDTHALASEASHRAVRGWAETIKEDCLMMMDALRRVEGVIEAGDYDTAILETEVIEEASRVLTRAIKTAYSAIDAAPGKKAARGRGQRAAPAAG